MSGLVSSVNFWFGSDFGRQRFWAIARQCKLHDLGMLLYPTLEQDQTTKPNLNEETLTDFTIAIANTSAAQQKK